jgi:hypothetical protein
MLPRSAYCHCILMSPTLRVIFMMTVAVFIHPDLALGTMVHTYGNITSYFVMSCYIAFNLLRVMVMCKPCMYY